MEIFLLHIFLNCFDTVPPCVMIFLYFLSDGVCLIVFSLFLFDRLDIIIFSTIMCSCVLGIRRFVFCCLGVRVSHFEVTSLS